MIGPIDHYMHHQQNGIVQSVYGFTMDVKEQKPVVNAEERGASIMISTSSINV
jgi:hypothetical protein